MLKAGASFAECCKTNSLILISHNEQPAQTGPLREGDHGIVEAKVTAARGVCLNVVQTRGAAFESWTLNVERWKLSPAQRRWNSGGAPAATVPAALNVQRSTFNVQLSMPPLPPNLHHFQSRPVFTFPGHFS